MPWYGQVLETIPSWLNTLRYRNSGKFKLCRSAFHDFSLDATSLAADLSFMLNLAWEEEAKSDMLAFFQACQDEETGFYYEPFYRQALDLSIDRILEMSGTYFGYQVGGVLWAMGQPPKHPFRFYEQFLKPGSMTKYMTEKMPWHRSTMGAGNMVDHGATMLRWNIRMGLLAYSQPLQEMYAWLEQHQDARTGLWGDKDAQGNNGLVQGGYHLLRGTYFTDSRPINYPEKIIDTILSSLKELKVFCAGEGEGCHDLDHFFLLQRALVYSNGYRETEIREMAEKRLIDIQKIYRQDGGFSFEAKKAITNHNRYEVSPGNLESDLVGTVFYLETIYRICKILHLPTLWQSSVTHGVLN